MRKNSKSHSKPVNGVVTQSLTPVSTVGDLFARFQEIDRETYDNNTEASRIRLRISNNGQRLEAFKLAFRAGALKLQDGHLMLVAASE